MNILIRVDASSKIGSGHLMRCLALARGLVKHGASVRFAMRDLSPAMLDMVMPEFPLSLLPARYESETSEATVESVVPWNDDLAAVEQALDGDTVDWCIVDHYGLDAAWEDGARAFAQRLMVIDDLANRPHATDILLDQNLTASESAYAGLVSSQCKQLLGPSYALLRDEFAAYEERQPAEPVQHVLVNFGGADPTGETLKVLDALQGLSAVEVEVVAGKANPAWPAVRDRCKEKGWQAHHHVDDMAARMRRANIAVGAGGTMTWERAATGLPTVCVAVAANQVANAQLMAECGAQLYVGRSAEVTVPMMAAALRKLVDDADLRVSMAQQSRLLVDGRGVDRACTALYEFGNGRMPRSMTLRLRRATMADARMLFDWRNEPATRAASHQVEPLSYDSHLGWMQATLANPLRRLLVAEESGKAVGTVRIDFQTGNLALLSWSVAADARGRGVAKRMVSMAIQEVPAEYTVRAEIKSDNVASMKVAEAAGLQLSMQEGATCYFVRQAAGQPNKGRVD
jgi:UDP-2,4-diacetamido-2,4,6-trideoxy-beta-L-altropyranose hydrolase